MSELFAATSVWAPLWVMLVAASPVGEVRFSIPLAVFYFQMGWAEAAVWSLIGNFGIIPVLFWVIPRIEWLVRRTKSGNRMLDWMFARTRKKHSARVEKYEEVALLMFIATPIPGTGAWSGAVVAHLFGLPWAKAWRFCYAGVAIACSLVVALVELGGFTFGVVNP